VSLFEGAWRTSGALVEGAAVNGETGSLTEGDWESTSGVLFEGRWAYGGDEDLYEGTSSSAPI
jgi:hypothetical protein